MRYILTAFILIFCYITIPQSFVIAQEDSSNTEIWNDNFWEEGSVSLFSKSYPTVEVQYGMGEPSIHKDVFKSSFEKVSSIEARFGYTSKKEKLFGEDVFEYNFSYFFLGNISSNWSKKESAASLKLNTDAWQFGFGFTGGYGYKFSEKSDLVLYNSGALVWTKTDFMDTTNINDQAKLDHIGSNFRFGEYMEGGIKYQVYEPFAITAGYQRIIVFPRHMFWKWLGSGVIEGVGDAIISHFTEKIIESSPMWGPVIHFVLKNAYSYGFFEIRKKRMNWPFDTETPFMYDNFKIGMSFAF